MPTALDRLIKTLDSHLPFTDENRFDPKTPTRFSSLLAHIRKRVHDPSFNAVFFHDNLLTYSRFSRT